MHMRPFTGVIAAPMLPMLEGGDIDWPALERYMDWIAAQQPAAIVMNVDASEVIALDEEEQLQVIRVCRETIAGRVPFFSGLVAGSTRAAARRSLQRVARRRRSRPAPASRGARSAQLRSSSCPANVRRRAAWPRAAPLQQQA